MLNDLWNPRVERCGFILTSGEIIEVENCHPQPNNNFAINPIEFERKDILAVWHTHPSDEVNLSVEDYHAFLSFPQYEHIIIGCTDRAHYYVRGELVYRRDDPNDFVF